VLTEILRKRAAFTRLPLGPSLAKAQHIVPERSSPKERTVLLYTLVQMIDYPISVVSMVVIVQFVLSLLDQLQRGQHQQQRGRRDLARAQRHSRSAAGADPSLHAQHRRHRFSPMVLIVPLRLLSILLNGLAASGY
jgi:YggT family protein